MIMQSTAKLWQDIRDAQRESGHDPDEIFPFLYLYTDKKVNKSLDRQQGSRYASKLSGIAASNPLHIYVDPKNQKLFRHTRPVYILLIDNDKPDDINDWLEPYPTNKKLLSHILENIS